MDRPKLEVGDIFRRYGEAYRDKHGASMSPAQRRVMTALELCRTAALGGHLEQCDGCGHERNCYNSCADRHCPKCQSLARAQWIEDRQSELLEVPYFHVVYTMPAEIAAIAYQNKEVVYGILFQATAETMRTIAIDPQHLGAEIGFFAVLHTWGQALQHHPHLHCVVPGGGISPDGQRWVSCRPDYFLPVPVLSCLFRRLFLYTVVATDSSKTPTASSFTLDLLRTVNACSVPAAQGATVNGAVSATAPFLAYGIAAASGDVLSLRSSSSTAGFAAQMELYDPNGARLDAGVFSLSRKAAASGTYTVILGAAAPLTAGGYSFAWQLLNRPAGASPLACGATIASALSPSSQFNYYTLAASAGDILRLIFTSIGDNFSPQMEVFDPSGTRIAAKSDVTQMAAAGGNYLVVVSPSTSNTGTGAYSVAFQRPNNPCSPLSLTCGQTALRQVNLPGQLDTFAFKATGGDQTTIRLAARSGAYSPFVEMYNPAGTLLSTSSNGLLSRVLPADGAYTLLVRDRGAINLGSYRVSLQDDTNTCAVTDTEAPTITLIRPTGGEVLPGGTTFRIQWASDDNVGVVAQAIALSTDSGKTFADPFASLNGTLQAYDWSVPSDIAPSRTAVIRVTATDAAGNAQSATSDLLTLIGSGFTPNSTATYTYDGFNRVTQATWSDGTSISYTWDAARNLTQITIAGQYDPGKTGDRGEKPHAIMPGWPLE